jgi:hypothetical protein
MLNQAIVVGRVVDFDLHDELLIEVTRNYRNKNGIYEFDVITAKDYLHILKPALKYLEVGKVIAVKGRLEVTNLGLEFVIEKISFVS